MEFGFEYTFPDGMEEIATGALTGVAGVLTGIFLIFYLLMMGLSVVCYVLNAVGLYRIAKRRGIHHAWLSWIPVGHNWLLGSISDHYQYVAKQKVTKKRKILLILSILLLVAFILLGVGVTVMVLTEASVANSVLGVALLVMLYFAMVGLAIAITVFCYIAYFDLFRSCRPEHDVLFLVLGIFFNILLAFFVFACCNYDKGMPNKRPKQPDMMDVDPEEETITSETGNVATEEETVAPEVETLAVDDDVLEAFEKIEDFD